MKILVKGGVECPIDCLKKEYIEVTFSWNKKPVWTHEENVNFDLHIFKG